jgi:hypothetical protein
VHTCTRRSALVRQLRLVLLVLLAEALVEPEPELAPATPLSVQLARAP